MNEDQGRVRANDHAGSHAGAEAVRKRAPTQKMRLLDIYAIDAGDGLTDDEAAYEADLLRSCFWKRCGELRQKGLIEDTGRTRVGYMGVAKMVCQITEAGRVEWKRQWQSTT